MALPVAHWAVAFGSTRSRDRLVLLFLALLSILPDFDFFFVWFLGLPIEVFHRTFSHSILFALLLTLLFVRFRPSRLEVVSPSLFFWVLASHSVLDLLCTLDAADHGIMVFWPLSESRWGWPVLVPLYQYFGDSPFSPAGALKFTLLELLLALPLWYVVRNSRKWWLGLYGRGYPSDRIETQAP